MSVPNKDGGDDNDDTKDKMVMMMMMMMQRIRWCSGETSPRIFTSGRETRNSCPSRLKMSSFHRQPYVGHAAPFLFKCSRQTNQIHQTNVLLISAISWAVQISF